MTTFDYRRRLTGDDWKRLLGLAAGAGLAVAAVTGYFGRIMLQRERIERPRGDPRADRVEERLPGSPDRPVLP